MNVTSSEHSMKKPIIHQEPATTEELGRLTHNLMGSISALLMCEHMLGKELGATEEFQNNATLRTTLMLLKQTADQIRDTGDDLMTISNRFRKARADA